jgi:Fe2+ transport system protein FeoA
MGELGLRVGERLKMIRPGSPCMVQVHGCRLSLRGDACMRIMVRPVVAAS